MMPASEERDRPTADVPPQSYSRAALLRELMIPVFMLGTVALYLYDTRKLSSAALIFPIALVIVIVAAALWSLVSALLASRGPPCSPQTTDLGEDVRGPIIAFAPWFLIIFPAILIFLQEYTGSLLAVLALVFGCQIVFTRRNPIRSLIISIVIAVPTYALFKYFLYVRFPDGLIGIG